MIEEWKTIKGWEDYQISNLGNVWSKKRKMQLKLSSNLDGYQRICLHNGSYRKWFYVHDLVARHFIDDPPDWLELEVNHKDNDRSNNRVDNLQWCDHAYNMYYSTGNQDRISNCKKSSHKPIQIVETGEIYDSIAAACRERGWSYNYICQVCGTDRTAYGYHFIRLS